ncbi:hypothetical protein [Kineococcus rhizosphaerae]|uniref:Uncharacterized protein n=1 Tax=Kineococcus rhizosphaerae TaxID=559628 RepID=A0A2T0QX78_9ACTN|nr:hypothetical protein [Kineococcus rhizosphaerae]PRY10488.1 hypothetical protein CLV37_11641 [Kineococcus rhizosphaerae]
MSQLVVEIHVPLTPAPTVTDDDYPYPWIEEVEDHLAELEEAGDLEVHDDGEEIDDEYVFFITGGAEERLLRGASRIATRDGVPRGTYAVVSSDDAEDIGTGRRVDLPL